MDEDDRRVKDLLTRRGALGTGAAVGAFALLGGATCASSKKPTEPSGGRGPAHGDAILRGQAALLPSKAPTITFETPADYKQEYDGPAASLRWRWRAFAAGSARQYGAYFDADGGFNTGLSITCSNKRTEDGTILGVVCKPISQGHEPSMVAVSPDVNGPSLAVEAHGNKGAGHENQAALAVYNLDQVHSGGEGHQTDGYGTKRFEIDGKGGLWWGLNLVDDARATHNVKLEPVSLGSDPRGLRVTGKGSSTTLELFASAPDSGGMRNWGIVANYNSAGDLAFRSSTTSKDAPAQRGLVASLESGGDLRFTKTSKGPIIKSPDGSSYRIIVDDDGELGTVAA